MKISIITICFNAGAYLEEALNSFFSQDYNNKDGLLSINESILFYPYPDEVRKGDLIFFKTNGRKIINHVGMVVEVLEDEIKFIHSATSKGVIISSTKEPYYKKTFVQVNRIYSSF